MRFQLKQGQKRKLKLLIRKKFQLQEESDINLDALNKSQMLHPRRVIRSSQVFRRFIAFYESFNKKMITKESQVNSANAKSQKIQVKDDILLAYKKIKYLPASFNKVFVKVKKPKIQQEYEFDQLIKTKTKKLYQQMKREREDYNKLTKLKVQKITKNIKKQSELSKFTKKYNKQAKKYLSIVYHAKEQNKHLKLVHELDVMLNTLNDTVFHVHLFPDYNEVHLTKLDLLYTNQHYLFNEQIFGIDLPKTYALNFAIENMLIPLSFLFLDMMINTTGLTYYNLYTQNSNDYLNQIKDNYIALVVLFGIAILLRPFANYHFIMSTKTSRQRWLSMLNSILVYFLYQIFVRLNFTINLKEFFCFVLSNYLVVYVQEQMEQKWHLKQDMQIIQVLKGHLFQQDFFQAKKFENQMLLIHEELGREAFNKVVEDLLISNHPKQINHLAPSVFPMRKKIDPDYSRLTSMWGGGYPRPVVEFSESLWDFTDAVKLIKGPKSDLILKKLTQQSNPDIDLADLVYFKQQSWEEEYGKVVINMSKYKLAQDNLDLNKQKQQRELLRQKAYYELQKKQEDEEKRIMLQKTKLEDKDILKSSKYAESMKVNRNSEMKLQDPDVDRRTLDSRNPQSHSKNNFKVDEAVDLNQQSQNKFLKNQQDLVKQQQQQLEIAKIKEQKLQQELYTQKNMLEQQQKLQQEQFMQTQMWMMAYSAYQQQMQMQQMRASQTSSFGMLSTMQSQMSQSHTTKKLNPISDQIVEEEEEYDEEDYGDEAEEQKVQDIDDVIRNKKEEGGKIDSNQIDSTINPSNDQQQPDMSYDLNIAEDNDNLIDSKRMLLGSKQSNKSQASAKSNQFMRESKNSMRSTKSKKDDIDDRNTVQNEMKLRNLVAPENKSNDIREDVSPKSNNKSQLLFYQKNDKEDQLTDIEAEAEEDKKQ
ncbi:UNKNOWN [Stylonychia lemnae]|uniref:Transmembrane protein n=1 Tax=Stylonychia lemnae TaxID=5949 RepID=A0A078B865_STYLE|nr:UNKNOWN [Stylonychia lemnae]|eukprot:CDW90376.1 UNKNOWN [Stylonychia lemnae]